MQNWSNFFLRKENNEGARFTDLELFGDRQAAGGEVAVIGDVKLSDLYELVVDGRPSRMLGAIDAAEVSFGGELHRVHRHSQIRRFDRSRQNGPIDENHAR